MHKKAGVLSLCALAFGLLSGCGEVERGYGDGDAETEEAQVIKGFYQSVYRDDDLNKAKQFASERMDGLIDHYATLNGVERYVLGRYFDQVELTIEAESIVPYLNKKQERRVTVIFDGKYNDETVKDSRDVVLVQEEGQWRVDQILDARYRP
jgi:hypothetical protein